VSVENDVGRIQKDVEELKKKVDEINKTLKEIYELLEREHLSELQKNDKIEKVTYVGGD